MLFYVLVIGAILLWMAAFVLAVVLMVSPGILKRVTGLLLFLAASIGVPGFAMLTRCVAEGSLVDTPRGPRPIESLVAGEQVWSRTATGDMDLSTVVSIERHFAPWFLRITFSNGRRLEVTASHPLATESGWINAGALSPAQWVEGRFETLSVSGMETVMAPTFVYDVTVRPHENFFANGVLVHNKSQSNLEGQAIGDTRNVISAMMTFASANCGFFPRDLSDATTGDGTPISIPSYPTNAPDFLGTDVARAGEYAKSGYLRKYMTFGTPDSIPPECAPDSVLDFCYASRPLPSVQPNPWIRPGFRSFVGTSDGSIYQDPKGATCRASTDVHPLLHCP